MNRCEFLCRTVEDTRNLGRLLGKVSFPGLVVILKGDLGCGKTEFVRGMAVAMGISENEISSPSFNVVHEYDNFVHMDLYRVKGNFEDIGIEEILEDERIKAIEWGEPVLEELEGLPFVVVSCRESEEGRIFEIEDYTGKVCDKLKKLYEGGIDVQNS
ncbi:tRNA threonylcarbamoyladenosine biosynthesis protein TsaE [Desulfurobacterium pacificum]|uniref:tRNA threonylcarbamoyladenosine biosynthesis protein TsaE n=1 Tax=Desulfurobacterium pacificum TaxID=240166 RepID=A0ABY1NV16_9BACT|nr:tRNA threonylcarbamoyladenosine biosynthesis protein TsaE [Desulfurobacterium pacificum]